MNAQSQFTPGASVYLAKKMTDVQEHSNNDSWLPIWTDTQAGVPAVPLASKENMNVGKLKISAISVQVKATRLEIVRGRERIRA